MIVQINIIIINYHYKKTKRKNIIKDRVNHGTRLISIVIKLDWKLSSYKIQGQAS
jgi:hypothetical protein